MNATEILNLVRADYADLLTDNRPLLAVENVCDGNLYKLVCEAGYCSTKEVGDLFGWYRPIRQLAPILCESAAMNRAEKAGIGHYDCLDDFLAAAQPIATA
jgi:hypothetical protein